MIHEIPKPVLSPAFTIKDIHRIREWEYERMKDATLNECRMDTEQRLVKALERLGVLNDKNNKNLIYSIPTD